MRIPLEFPGKRIWKSSWRTINLRRLEIERTCRAMSVDLPAKLRATMTALGCGSRKGLIARFRANNPQTSLELDSLHKWMQGRASPRSTAFYTEWAAVLGIARGADWIATATLEAFVAEVASATGIEESRLFRGNAPAARKAADEAPGLGLVGGVGSLVGTFACYSHAFSPRREGYLVRGLMRVELSGRTALLAHYSETLSVGPVAMSGPVSVDGRTMSISLLESSSGVPIFVVLHMPGSPPNLLSGLLTCSTLMANESLPSCSRFLAIRVPLRAGLESGNRYFRALPGAIAEDLQAAGGVLNDSAGFDRCARAYLGAEPYRAHLAAQNDLAAHLSDELGGVLPPS
jgi:hypothetical protein